MYRRIRLVPNVQCNRSLRALLSLGRKPHYSCEEIIEGMQFIQDTNDAGAEELGLGSGDTLFSAWLLEAARGSLECYAAHGQMACDARTRRGQDTDMVLRELDCHSDYTDRR